MPQGIHSTIQGEMVPSLNQVLNPSRLARAYPELRCTFGGRSIVPDVAVFSWECIPRDENGEVANVFAIAPDWTIEILSPDQSQSKVVRNILHCLAHRSQMGWLIDPEEKWVFVYFADQRVVSFDQPDERLPVPGFAEVFGLTVGELFGWLAV